MTTIKHTTTVKASHDDVIDHIVGMTEEQAVRTLKLNGVDNIRVMKDPKAPYTAEHRSDRVNLIIEGNKVIQATRG
jgi:hypothetical protein